MDRKELMNYLELYGSDLDKWPSGLREEAGRACAASPELRAAFEEEKRFEEALMDRGFEEPSPGLEARIISAAHSLKRPEPAKISVLGLLGAVFSAMPLPRPAIALPLLLVIGMAVGYLYSNYSNNDSDNSIYAELMYYGEGYYE
ncbi:MAG TPA: hypothetical protein VHC46_02010 [Thermodesulfobacteriota bacterium]|nr:hypothetical protein [Thermodesulfobacteriota bacterium]